WGHKDIPRQWGIQTNALSSNQLRPLAGASHNATFNTFRRVKGQFLYVAPPLAAALLLIEWAERRNKFLNSKEGR
ncbi:putative ubiquinol-cytochrome C reductase complex subunit UcrQ, partial [Bisporella sp. PMI_857]